ncbi:hypothetical protein [Bacteroides sp. 51]|uniref:hypothetical protein n=1 Tax=Bacteroides sp. 51 TaxID=2302938 RepID=UPI0013D0292B|nr:hypothetical protein [Bacteroides sp. 51]NDV83477.1 hypothetical protein [Bacteroides sp. 51]
MNKIAKITAFLMAGLWITMFMSCSDDDKWNPGPEVSANNPGVYFDKSNPYITELGCSNQMILDADHITVLMGRDKNKTASALQVPIIVRRAASNLTIPQTVEFAAGQEFAELQIKLGEWEVSTRYDFCIDISEEYADPYKLYTDTDGGSSRYDAKMEVVCLLGTATFVPGEYGGSTKPQFTPFVHKIYDNLDGSYTIKNFLYNNAGFSFTFSVDDDNKIIPDPECGYHSTSDNRWYFYSANSSSSSNYIPCYIPGANPSDNVSYIYFYTKGNKSEGFWLDKETRTGKMVGYSRYSVSSSGVITFNFTW